MTDVQGLLLAIVSQRSRPSHGFELGREAEQRTGRLISAATLYRSLHRLEDSGYLSGEWEDADGKQAAHRGPKRRYYTITAPGQLALSRHLFHVQRVARALGLPTVESAR